MNKPRLKNIAVAVTVGLIAVPVAALIINCMTPLP
jgi:hypothetical protein